MKTIKLLIGIALVLMLCISPVVAVSGSDFEIVIDDSGDIVTYKYLNPNYRKHPGCPNSLGEKYIQIYTKGTRFLYSLVSFKPANIPGAPVMLVETTGYKINFYLPQSVDEWEIRYYSITHPINPGEHVKYLKNAGVVNLNEYFGEYIKRGLFFRTYHEPLIQCQVLLDSSPVYFFPEED